MQNKFFLISFLGLFFFKTNVGFSQDKNVYNFSADRLTYSQDNNIIEASGNVVAKNQIGQKISSENEPQYTQIFLIIKNSKNTIKYLLPKIYKIDEIDIIRFKNFNHNLITEVEY
jgi:hypothetical protein